MPNDELRRYYGMRGPYSAFVGRHDEEIAQEVRNRLVWDSWVDANQVQVQVQDGLVTLTGEVDSVVEKRAAGDDAWDTVGVADVYNLLQVRQPAPER